MPSYELTGPERVYPYLRDANGNPIGIAQPGDIRFFDEEPDSWWVPVIPPGTNELPSDDEQAPADALAQLKTMGLDAASLDQIVQADAPAPEPEPAAAPVPAPPAVVPPAGSSAFAVTAGQQ
jgi:hypothetical protein